MYEWDDLAEFLHGQEIDLPRINQFSSRFDEMKGEGTVITDPDLHYVFEEDQSLITEFQAFCYAS